ncbi:MAG: LLM class flavin-dependent oxidoreductase [Myxococcota bacterium]
MTSEVDACGPARVRLGVALVANPSFQESPKPPSPPDLERLAAAEAAGAQALWVFGARGACDHDVVQCAAAAASCTRSARIVVAGLRWPPDSWLRAAEDLATLDALSGGRLEVAVRVAPAGGSASPAAGLEDLALVRRAWQRGPVEYESERHRVAGVDVHPKPAQESGPPVWVWAEGGPSAVALAVRAEAGLLLEARSGVDALRPHLETIEAGAPEGSSELRGLRLAVRVDAESALGAGWGAAARERARAIRFRRAAVPEQLDWIEAVSSDSGASKGGPTV